jgi:hypothetical protein
MTHNITHNIITYVPLDAGQNQQGPFAERSRLSRSFTETCAITSGNLPEAPPAEATTGSVSSAALSS